MNLPHPFAWLRHEPAPKHLLAALRYYGVKEIVGPVHNPVILGWAQELGVLDVYTSDEIPWCGLFLAKAMEDVGRLPPKYFYRALNWAEWGGLCGGGPSLGDVL